MKNKKQGITLIALVITIIVLLILAGITINAISGNEGVLDKAQSAKINTDVGNLKEEASLASMDYKVQTEKENDFEYYINKLNNVTKTKLALDTFYLERGEAKITVNADGEIIEGKADVWDGTSTTPTIDETSKEIHIYTTKELKGLADLVNGGNNLEGYKIYLENDLDFGARAQNGEWETEDNNQNRKWTPIAKEKANQLKATFYGQNHIIKGVYVNETTIYAGLFGNSYGIEDLTIKNSYIKNTNACTGGIVAALRSESIKNCHNINTIVQGGIDEQDRSYTGGIVGQLSKGTISIENCTNTGMISGVGRNVGGIVGYSNAIITNCKNTAKIEGNNNVGGIVGIMFLTIKNCCNYGSVIGNEQFTGDSESNENEQCIGGVIGQTGMNTSNLITITIENCYNRANVSGVNCVGGVVGWISATNTQGTVNNNYNTGSVTATAKSAEVGGVIGHLTSQAFTVSNNYTLQGTAVSAGRGIEKNITEMKTDTFVQLLGANNWTRVEGKNDGYPILKWEV